MTFTVRRATERDLGRLNDLLYQVCRVHHEGRPDLFKGGAKKYTDEELLALLREETRPVLVAVDESDVVQGYAFCQLQQYCNSNNMTDVKTLYIDDLCVEEKMRGHHIGTLLYDAVLALAREQRCYNVTLNVWSLNESAMRFYQARGLVPQKVGMEHIL